MSVFAKNPQKESRDGNSPLRRVGANSPANNVMISSGSSNTMFSSGKANKKNFHLPAFQ